MVGILNIIFKILRSTSDSKPTTYVIMYNVFNNLQITVEWRLSFHFNNQSGRHSITITVMRIPLCSYMTTTNKTGTSLTLGAYRWKYVYVSIESEWPTTKRSIENLMKQRKGMNGYRNARQHNIVIIKLLLPKFLYDFLRLVFAYFLQCF